MAPARTNRRCLREGACEKKNLACMEGDFSLREECLSENTKEKPPPIEGNTELLEDRSAKKENMFGDMDRI